MKQHLYTIHIYESDVEDMNKILIELSDRILDVDKSKVFQIKDSCLVSYNIVCDLETYQEITAELQRLE